MFRAAMEVPCVAVRRVTPDCVSVLIVTVLQKLKADYTLRIVDPVEHSSLAFELGYSCKMRVEMKATVSNRDQRFFDGLSWPLESVDSQTVFCFHFLCCIFSLHMSPVI